MTQPAMESERDLDPKAWTVESLQELEEAIAEKLGTATRHYRGFAAPLSGQEVAHAKRYAKFVVAMMSQERCRAAQQEQQAVVNRFIAGTKAEAEVANEDHSAWPLISKAVDDVLSSVRDYFPLSLTLAMFRGAGVQE